MYLYLQSLAGAKDVHASRDYFLLDKGAGSSPKNSSFTSKEFAPVYR